MKKTILFMLTAFIAVAFSSVAMAITDSEVTASEAKASEVTASEAKATEASQATISVPEVKSAALNTVGMIALAAGLSIGIGAIGPGIAQGLATKGAVEAIARNPEAAPTIRLNMITGLALMESLTIYALVISLLLIYVFPYRSMISKILQ